MLYKPKPGWQDGWFAQHQRLIGALGKQTQRCPVIVEEDFHSSAAGKMMRVGDISLIGNPVYVVLGGTLDTGDYAFPSQVRSVESTPSELVAM